MSLKFKLILIYRKFINFLILTDYQLRFWPRMVWHNTKEGKATYILNKATYKKTTLKDVILTTYPSFEEIHQFIKEFDEYKN